MRAEIEVYYSDYVNIPHNAGFELVFYDNDDKEVFREVIGSVNIPQELVRAAKDRDIILAIVKASIICSDYFEE